MVVRQAERIDQPEAEVAELRRQLGQNSQVIFTTKWGTPIEPRNFNRSWDARCAKARVRKITVHDGRRTCATLLVDLDVHPREVMQILRHAQISVTMEIYAQASSRATRAALKRLGDSLNGSGSPRPEHVAVRGGNECSRIDRTRAVG